MHYLILLVYLYVIIYPSWCWSSHACHFLSAQNLNENECEESFGIAEKERTVNKLRLELNESVLRFTTPGAPWNSMHLSISLYGNGTKQLCQRISNESCVNFNQQRLQNESYLVQYKSPEIGAGKLLFSLPKQPKFPLFLYIDIFDLSQLVLRSYLVDSSHNLSHVKVEAFKEKNNITTLLDTQEFSDVADIDYELFTYNDEGNYYFVVGVVYSNNSLVCIETPKVFVGRKRTRLVIGIVGASFILPFVLFVFHILTRKYPENKEADIKIAVIYKSSSKKHNEVVNALVTLLQANCQEQVAIELLDISRSRKICNSSILFASQVVYVAPPIQDKEHIFISKILSQKEIYTIIFDHCTDNLPEFFTNRKSFKLLDDFDKLLSILNLPKVDEHSPLFTDLKRKTDEAKVETDLYLNDNVLPKIIVTSSEPEEQEALISSKIVV